MSRENPLPLGEGRVRVSGRAQPVSTNWTFGSLRRSVPKSDERRLSSKAGRHGSVADVKAARQK